MPTDDSLAILFTNAQVFDGTGRAPFHGEVLVKGNRIDAVAEAGVRVDGEALPPPDPRWKRDDGGRTPGGLAPLLIMIVVFIGGFVRRTVGRGIVTKIIE